MHLRVKVSLFQKVSCFHICFLFPSQLRSYLFIFPDFKVGLGVILQGLEAIPNVYEYVPCKS